MTTPKRYTRKDLRLVWGTGFGADAHFGERSARVGERHVLFVSRRHRSEGDGWKWLLNDAPTDGSRRGWLINSGVLPDASTALQAMAMAEEAMRAFARGLLVALEGGAS